MGKGGQDYGKSEKSGVDSKGAEDCCAMWSKDVRECEEKYQVSRERGLSEDDVQKRRQIYGLNELEKHEGPSIFRLILDQFNDTLVRILLVAAVVSFVLAWYDGEEGGEMEITAFENNAEKALDALKEIQSEHATVIREGRRIPNLPAKELVPGDIVELRVGDKVPADMRVISLISSTLRVEQGSLTGESEAVSKSTKPVAEDVDIQGKKSMVFAGTTVVNGNCICLVTQTGMKTEIGKVHSQIHEASQSDDDTPLKKKLNEFGETLTAIIGAICTLVWLINLKYFLSWDFVDGRPRNFKFSFEKCTYYFEIAVALAVAAIPEGLPAVITTCLALGTRKMAAKNALVRKLPSVETLGCTTVICSDKTGTLTTNQMAVVELVAMGSKSNVLRSFTVRGTTYDPFDGEIENWPTGRLDPNLQMIAKIAAICNDADVGKAGHDISGHYVANGMPTEAALKVLVEKMGLPNELSAGPSAHDGVLSKLSFYHTEILVNSSGNCSVMQGAVETLLTRSSFVQLLDGSIRELDESSRNAILKSLHEMSTSGLRVLGFAYRDDLPEFATYNGDEDHPAHELLLNPGNYSSIESKLIFVGLAGLRDPPRKEVPQAIEDCRTAGIRVMVITGDNKDTAEAICRDIGVFGRHENISSRSLTGKDFMELSSHDKEMHLNQSGGLLFSRAEPRHKQEIVRLLKDLGEVVAMTGDGVNDAPALKLADIGIAMGITGTEVAKEASDMVLADDNFSTIVAAVGEGRSIYNNMKAFISVKVTMGLNQVKLNTELVDYRFMDDILYMISSNIGEVASIFLTAALGIPEGLIPVQLLWVNLVTDGPPATALGFNPPDKDIMKKPPRRSDDSLISPWILFRYLVIGSYVGLATVGVFIIWYTQSSFLGIDLSEDGHSLVKYSQLAKWGQCQTWQNFSASPFTAGDQVFKFDNPCDYFQTGKIKAMTLSLSVLVAIEMFNSLNALSEDGSLFSMPPWANLWLLLAMSVSFGLHFLILYVPFLAQIFGIVPLSLNEWLLVLAVAFPVILIDEVLKFVGRCTSGVKTSSARRSTKQKAE
ncbi:UNVERIFIED_CONTAM: Calcium-transporting ATPase 4, endoplasmic reticulum-type [Sesamum radiatum]|uniref:P-type Ca(2+) transporter n=1 Tax=Sesamum radiatum TaxID=300843 RepID=A0AAW2UK91_SESRA